MSHKKTIEQLLAMIASEQVLLDALCGKTGSAHFEEFCRSGKLSLAEAAEHTRRRDMEMAAVALEEGVHYRRLAEDGVRLFGHRVRTESAA